MKLEESGKRRGRHEMARAMGLLDSFRRRLVSLAFATTLAIEGVSGSLEATDYVALPNLRRSNSTA